MKTESGGRQQRTREPPQGESLFIGSGVSPASTSVPNPAKESTTACNQHVDGTTGAKLEGNVRAEPQDPTCSSGQGCP